MIKHKRQHRVLMNVGRPARMKCMSITQHGGLLSHWER
jgi:hypothetical protein